MLLTVQTGAALAVKIPGDGLAATVTVGRRTFRFDGTKFVVVE